MITVELEYEQIDVLMVEGLKDSYTLCREWEDTAVMAAIDTVLEYLMPYVDYVEWIKER